MAKRLALIWAVFLLAALAAFAGDVAQVVNLGFSADSKYFMFGQYGISEKDTTPWAETYIVDVAANNFVRHGAAKSAGTHPVDPGATGLGALLNVLADSLPQKKQFHVDHLITGRLLYVLIDGAQAADTLEFRDFQSGKSYKIALTQSVSTKGTDTSSSFNIAVTVTDKDGRLHTFTAGSPNIARKGVKAYHIKQLILAPDGASLVFIVQREEQDGQGNNVRYMVETARPR
jgi:predicted secreted protein